MGYNEQPFKRNYFTASFKFGNKHKTFEVKNIQEGLSVQYPRSATQTGPGNTGKILAVAYLGDCVGCGSTPL